MQCPNCKTKIIPQPGEWVTARIEHHIEPLNYRVSLVLCANCHNPVVELAMEEASRDLDHYHEIIYPVKSRQVMDRPEVPREIFELYVKAAKVLEISPEASAALSRRVLQSVLNDQGYRQRDLANQLRAALEESDPHKVLSEGLKRDLQVVRNIGNFSAHPITNVTSLQIIDVEPEEAEWCLEIVSALFEHYYIRPVADKKKLDELNQKLASAGKPPVK